MQIKFLDKRLTEFKPATELSAGYDLRACIGVEYTLDPGQQLKIPTGISLNMMTERMQHELRQSDIEEELIVVPCAIIMPRSGLGCKGVKPRNAPGLIDADYQGEIIVCLYNEGNEAIRIQPMDRIAQLVFMVALHPQMEIVSEFEHSTKRGDGGFGSTGEQ